MFPVCHSIPEITDENMILSGGNLITNDDFMMI